MAAGTGDRSWTPDAIGSLLAMRGSFGYLAVEGDPPAPEPIGLVFCRSVTDEGETLVLAVLPGHWRRGLGRMVLAAAPERAVTPGMRRLLLEVAVDNHPGRGMEQAAGSRRSGARTDPSARAHQRAPAPIGLVFCRRVTDECETLVLAVLPGHWRRGLGRMLLAAALERAVTLGLRRILLDVAVDNEPARALYEAAGFRRVGRRRDYYRRADGRLVDALTLEVRLPP